MRLPCLAPAPAHRMAAAQQPLSPHRAKPYPLPVPDRRQLHVGGLFAGFLEEGCANEGHSLARTGGLGLEGSRGSSRNGGVPGGSSRRRIQRGAAASVVSQTSSPLV